jgi:hypothetical protein
MRKNIQRELKNFLGILKQMSYQTRLDQLEAEVLQTNSSTSLNYSMYLPYIGICVAALLSLYSFCPRPLQEKRGKQYHIRTDRFVCVWVVAAAALCVAYYKVSTTSSSS